MSSNICRKTLRKQATTETLSIFDALPDSASVRPAVIAAHSDISMATFWRRVKSGVLPSLKDGRMNVGEYRRAIASSNAAA
jgi:hypothetical protein